MPTTFRAYHPDQILLLAPDLREWVPEGHLSHQVSDLVDSLDLSVVLRAVCRRWASQRAL